MNRHSFPAEAFERERMVFDPSSGSSWSVLTTRHRDGTLEIKRIGTCRELDRATQSPVPAGFTRVYQSWHNDGENVNFEIIDREIKSGS